MLSKTKSKQIKLFKYALLIPIVFGMLVYTSSNGQGITDNTLSKTLETQDLSAYTYTVNVKEVNFDKLALERSKESKRKQENFLKSNLGYVIWVHDNSENQEFTYSLHSESEKIPDDYSLLDAISEEGFKYKMFAHKKFANNSKKTDLDEVDVPFSVIEQAPLFSDCVGLPKEEQKSCVSKIIQNHVNEKFNIKLAIEHELTGRQRINVIFKIDKEGRVTGVKSRASHPALEAEAIRVINTLPKMIPGMQKGKKVNVPYSLPIIFQVADEKEEEFVPLNEVVLADREFVFEDLDELPNILSCDNIEEKEEKKQCFSDAINRHIGENFNIKLANKLKLTGRQRINVIFKIDKKGNIIGIRSRAPHPDLEAEAVRVIKLLPKMTPGKINGENVVIHYSLPIIFQVPE